MKSHFLSRLTALCIFGTNAYAPPEGHAENQKQEYRQQLAQENPTLLLARALWGEARCCTREEQIAIGYTAVNRQKKSKRPLQEILLAGYTCFKGVSGKQVLAPHLYDDPKIFDECIQIARGILQGSYSDSTNGATHYYNPQRCTPSWAPDLKGKKRIQTSKGKSKHIFGKMK